MKKSTRIISGIIAIIMVAGVLFTVALVLFQ